MSRTDSTMTPQAEIAQRAVVAGAVLRQWADWPEENTSPPEFTADDVDSWLQKSQERLAAKRLSTADNEPTFSELDIMDALRHYHQGRLQKRIEELRQLAEEDAPDQEPLSLLSLRSFLDFLGLTHILRPNLVLTPTGNIRAKWKQVNRRHHISLEFLADRRVKYVVSVPDPRHTYLTTRAAGLATIDSVKDILRPFGLESWMISPHDSEA